MYSFFYSTNIVVCILCKVLNRIDEEQNILCSYGTYILESGERQKTKQIITVISVSDKCCFRNKQDCMIRTDGQRRLL